MKKVHMIVYVFLLLALVSSTSAERNGSVDYDDYYFIHFANGTTIDDMAGGKGHAIGGIMSTFTAHGDYYTVINVGENEGWGFIANSSITSGNASVEFDYSIIGDGFYYTLGSANSVTGFDTLAEHNVACAFQMKTDYIGYWGASDWASLCTPTHNIFLTYVMVYDIDNDKCSYAVYDSDGMIPTCSINNTNSLNTLSSINSSCLTQVKEDNGGSFDNMTIYAGNGIVDGKPQTGAPPPPPSETAAPTIAAPSPADNANNNANVTLNVTHNTANNDVRYYLYFGNSSTLTETDLYLTNATRTGDEHKSFVTNVSIDDVYYWKWKVQNTSDGTFSINTTQRTWTLDTVSPGINRLTNNNWKTDNTTIISSYLYNLTLNYSFFDTNLYQTLINITNSTEESMYSILNTSITGTTANYSRIIDISSWPLGNYTIKLSVTDSHTDLEWGDDVKVFKGLDYFRYTTPEGNVITIESDTFPLTKSTTQLVDRYDFEFSYLFQKDTYKYTIRSYNKINYLKGSEYKAHFIVMGSNQKGNWIDFENPDLNEKDYVITKIDDYTYEVEITANDLKSFTFSSLGGLNKVEKHYKLQIGAVLDIWVYDEENYPIQINATATSGLQSSSTTVYNQSNVSSARLVNITKEITELTLTSTGFGTEDKSISLINNYHNLSFNMTPVLATKLYFYDEISEALIGGETFSVYLEKTGFSSTYSATTNPYTITGLIGGLYKLKASSTNYLERQYLDLNVSNESTTNLNVYLINSTDSSEITFNIVDEGLNPLEDVRAVFTRLIGGTDTVIAEEDSDYAGQVVLDLDSNYRYKINFSKTNYEDQTINLEPKNSEYVIKMISTIGAYNQSVYEGIRYRFEPSNTVLNNGTRYNFTFTLNSSVWTVTNCTLRLKNGSIIMNETSSHTPSSCYISIERSTLDMTTITSEAIYELDSTYEFTVTQQYSIIYTYAGEFSLKNFLDDLSDFGMAGFDDFGRMILALIVIFIITTLAAQKIGFTNPEVLIFLVIAQVWFFSYVNWLYLDFAPIPTIAGFDLKKYIIAILISLAGGAFVIEKFTK